MTRKELTPYTYNGKKDKYVIKIWKDFYTKGSPLFSYQISIGEIKYKKVYAHEHGCRAKNTKEFKQYLQNEIRKMEGRKTLNNSPNIMDRNQIIRKVQKKLSGYRGCNASLFIENHYYYPSEKMYCVALSIEDNDYEEPFTGKTVYHISDRDLSIYLTDRNSQKWILNWILDSPMSFQTADNLDEDEVHEELCKVRWKESKTKVLILKGYHHIHYYHFGDIKLKK
jgi:hypothetical protein